MATLIPALGSCVARMTPGERRTAERLEQKLDADYLLWYDVAVGPRDQHPDFVVLHPRRGILILEVNDFRLATLIQANMQTWDSMRLSHLAAERTRLKYCFEPASRSERVHFYTSASLQFEQITNHP